MIVYIESNFVLELAFQREEHIACAEFLALAKSSVLQLVIPAFSLGEPYEAWVRRARRRSELQDQLGKEIKELSRSEPYRDLSKEFQELTGILVRSNEEEKRRLDESLDQILRVAQVRHPRRSRWLDE